MQKRSRFQPESGCFVDAEHQVHVLYSLTYGTLLTYLISNRL